MFLKNFVGSKIFTNFVNEGSIMKKIYIFTNLQILYIGSIIKKNIHTSITKINKCYRKSMRCKQMYEDGRKCKKM